MAFSPVPADKYEVELATLEIKGTKADNRPMLAASFRILSGKYKNRRLFQNYVLQGTKNDERMIQLAIDFLMFLNSGLSYYKDLRFKNYEQFTQLVAQVKDAVDGKRKYGVIYDPDEFNSIDITSVERLDECKTERVWRDGGRVIARK